MVDLKSVFKDNWWNVVLAAGILYTAVIRPVVASEYATNDALNIQIQRIETSQRELSQRVEKNADQVASDVKRILILLGERR